MWLGIDRANLITQSLQVDVFFDPLTTIVGHMTALRYLKTPKCVFNEPKRKSRLCHIY